MTAALSEKSPIRPGVGSASKMGYGYLDKLVCLGLGQLERHHLPSIVLEAPLHPEPVAKGNATRQT